MAYILQYGKYRGMPLFDVFESDFKYLDWLHSVTNCIELKLHIKDFIKQKKGATVNQYQVNCGKVHIGALQFKTKKDAKAMISQWLKYSYSGYVPSDEELSWIVPLLQMHPRFEEKALDMVAIEVSYSPPAFHFNIIKSDGTCEDMSYNKCLSGCANSKRHATLKACRDIIRPQIKEFRDGLLARGHVHCSVTGKRLCVNSMHIDHDYDQLPFRDMVSTFLGKEGLEYEDVEVLSLGVWHAFKDEELSKRWFDYHKDFAVLRVLDKEVHMAALCSSTPSHIEGKLRVFYRIIIWIFLPFLSHCKSI